jgi:hypothetical protein
MILYTLVRQNLYNGAILVQLSFYNNEGNLLV